MNQDKPNIPADKIAISDVNGVLFDSFFRYKIVEKFLNDLLPDDLETQSQKFEGYKEVIVQLQKKIKSEIERVKDTVTREGIKDIFDKILSDVPEKNDLLPLLTRGLKPLLKTDKYQELIKDNTRIIPGAEEMLLTLKDAGYKIILLTNQDQLTLETQIAHVEIAGEKIKDFVDGYKGDSGQKNGEGFLTPNKPNPKVAQELLDQVGVTENTQILILDDGLKNLLFRRDGEESRPNFASEKYGAARIVDANNPQEPGIQRGADIRVILINPEINEQSAVLYAIPSELEEIKDALARNGGCGNKVGWYPDYNSLNNDLAEVLKGKKNIIPNASVNLEGGGATVVKSRKTQVGET